MKVLSEITKIVTTRKLANIELLSLHNGQNGENKCGQFYDGLVNGSFADDQEAAKFLYNSTPSDIRYRVLKSKFKKRLFNTLFFLDAEQHYLSEYQKVYYACLRKYECFRVLAQNGCPNAALEIGKQLLNTAMVYQFNDLTIFTGRIIRNHFAVRGIKKEFAYYDALVKKCLKNIELDYYSLGLKEELAMEFAISKTAHPELISKAKRYSWQLRKLSKQSDSYLLHYNTYCVWSDYHLLNGDYKKAIKILERAEMYLKEHPDFCDVVKLSELVLNKLHCSLHLKDYKNGTKYAEEAKHLYPYGNTAQFTFMEYYFLLALHTNNYRAAKKQFDKAMQHPGLDTLAKEEKEKWEIFEIYLGLVSRKKLSRRKLHSFLNEILYFSKDKSGYNVSIQIAQILYRLENGDYQIISNKYNALYKYSRRYLNKPYSLRSYYFIKMLLIMIRSEFNYYKTIEKTKSCFTKLKSIKIKYQGNIESLEVIPYEVLWEMVLEKLKKKR